MQGHPTSFWGKLEMGADGSVLGWHPLESHCADVAAVCERLLTHTVLGTRLARLCGQPQLRPEQIERLSFIAALHDVGKYNRGFQNKARNRPPLAGHVVEVLSLFSGGTEASSRLQAALPLGALAAWGDDDACIRLLIASICHHGRPRAVAPQRIVDGTLWTQHDLGDPFEGIEQLVARARGWFLAAFSDGGAALPASPPLQHAFSGIVMLADWLGSDRRAFPFGPADDDRIEESRERAAWFLAEMGLEPTRARLALGERPPAFDRVSPHAPRPAQERILELPIATNGSIALIEAETGAGKTEAALAYFLKLFHAAEVDGLYIALPTRTAATQIFERTTAAMQRAFPDPPSRPPVTLAVPGYIAVDDAVGTRMPGFEVLWNDDPAERFRFRRWAAENSKRYLAGAIAIGTIDQSLMSSLVVSHAHLRASSLARHLLVVDEVHASDAYMLEILTEVLRFHTSMGGHALLMSATLGAAATAQLLGCLTRPNTVTPMAAAVDRPYPSVALGSSDGLDLLLPVATSGPGKQVKWSASGLAADPEAVAAIALDAARRSASVLIIRNTVADCIATQHALEQRAAAAGLEPVLFRVHGAAAPHHSRFAACDRKALDRAIESAMGRERDLLGRVVVATQTVQQSLDLDADLLITDLCPVDVLLQRIGRLHRHQRERPAGFEQASCMVLTPSTRDLSELIRPGGEPRGPQGLGSVYDDLRILEATWRQVALYPMIEIPADNRRLVEQATHPEALEQIVNELGSPWHLHHQWVLGRGAASYRIARDQLVARAQAFGDYEFPDAALGERISTRLGVSDRRVELPSCPAAFGGLVTELAIPAHLCRGAGSEDNATSVEPFERGFRFRFGSITFTYGRLGLVARG